MIDPKRLESAEQDLLWAMCAFARLAWPGSIADLFTMLGQPGLISEYQQVQANIEARRVALQDMSTVGAAVTLSSEIASET